ncbi:TSUP family transporter [Lysinibacillus irui]
MNITYFLKKQYNYVKAVELTRIISFSSCTGAFLFYYFTGIVNWGIAIPVSMGSIVGSFLGLKIIPYIKIKWVHLILPIIFFLLIVQIVTDLIK